MWNERGAGTTFVLRRHSIFSTFLFSEPDFSYLDALAPYQPLAMKCVYCPIDTRLNFIQVSKLLKEVQVMNSCCLFLCFFTHSSEINNLIVTVMLNNGKIR